MNETRRPSFDLIGTSSAQNVGGDTALSGGSGTLSPHLRKAFDEAMTARIAAMTARIEDEAWDEPCIRVPLWVCHLGVSRVQQLVLGRVFTIQTSCKDGKEQGYRRSLGGGAEELNVDRSTFRRSVRDLVRRGYLKKEQKDRRSTPNYTVDVLKCYETAIDNGFTPRFNVNRADRSALAQAAMQEWYSHVPLWACRTGITAREQIILGRIMGFQKHRKGSEHVAAFHMSLASAAKELGIKYKDDLWRTIRSLMEKGFVEASRNGDHAPTTYRVKVAEAYEAALANGYEPLNRANDRNRR